MRTSGVIDVDRPNKRLYCHEEVAMTAGEWAELFGLGYSYFYERIQALGDVEKAIAEILEMLNSTDAFDEDELEDEL